MSPPASKPVLLVACAYPPENVIGALRPYRFYRYLPQYGYTPHVVTGSVQPPDPPPNVHSVPYQPGLFERIVVNRILLPTDDRLSWYWKVIRKNEQLMREYSYRIVFSTSPPFVGHLAAHHLKKQFGVKWVADFRDPVCGGDGRTQFWIYALDRRVEETIFEHADLLVANTDAAVRFWKTRYPQHIKKMRVIYNGYDPETKHLRAAPLPQRPHRLLLHAGSLFTISMFEPFLDTVSAMIDGGRLDPASIRLRFLGDMASSRFFLEKPSFGKLHSTGVLDYTPNHIPLDQARKAMAECDYQILLDRYRTGGIIQLPAKIFEYIQIGRPILAFTDPGSPMEHVLGMSGIPHVCVYAGDSPAERESKLSRFLRLPTDPAVASPEYVSHFSAPCQTRQLAELFDSLL